MDSPPPAGSPGAFGYCECVGGNSGRKSSNPRREAGVKNLLL